jgi:hypothetical protein
MVVNVNLVITNRGKDYFEWIFRMFGLVGVKDGLFVVL